MIEIPFDIGEVATVTRILLDGEYYTLTVRWNERDQGWWLNVADGDGNQIVNGIPLRSDSPVAAHVQHVTNMPPGVFGVQDSTDKGLDPGFEDLGDRVLFFYLEAEDLETS
jgi:hypothetical protein